VDSGGYSACGRGNAVGLTSIFDRGQFLARRSLSIERIKHSSYRLVLKPICLSVDLPIRKVYCGKTADWFRMPLGVVSVVGIRMSVLDGGGDHRREGTVLGVNLGYAIVTNEELLHGCATATHCSQMTLGGLVLVDKPHSFCGYICPGGHFKMQK